MQKKLLITALVILVGFSFLLSTCEKKEIPVPDKITVAHILLMYKGSDRAPEEVTITKEEAYEQTFKLLERIKAGEDFTELAMEYSDCPSSAKGGELAEFGRGAMVKPFEDVAFELKKGELSDIVETPFGYHIIKRLK